MTSRTRFIDIAVIKHEYTEPIIADTVLILKHSDIYPKIGAIPANVFKDLFFNSSGIFSPITNSQLSGLIPTSPYTLEDYTNIVSLGNPKEIEGNELDLPEMLIQYIEDRLSTYRDMLTRCSVIELTRSINNLLYFSNITENSAPSSFVCNLTWNEILKSIYHLAPNKDNGTVYRAVLRITVYLEATTTAPKAPIPPFGITYNFSVDFPISYNSAV